jgi:hypothetical protein
MLYYPHLLEHLEKAASAKVQTFLPSSIKHWIKISFIDHLLSPNMKLSAVFATMALFGFSLAGSVSLNGLEARDYCVSNLFTFLPSKNV